MQGADRGAALTQRMLAFARRQDLKAEPLDVKVLVDGMADLVRHTLGPRWNFRIALEDGLPWIVADANQLELALLNLAVNARDAMPEGGNITVSSATVRVDEGAITYLAAGSFLKLSVSDQGTGMDEATLKRAAEPFFTTKGVGKGTGLGLSMVHGLATQMNGTFTLESRVGSGTTASLWIPVAGDVNVADRQLDTGVPAMDVLQRRLRILAVDDDTLILMNTAALLEDLGHEVVTAESGTDAIRLINEGAQFDLLITDQAMPGMAGADLAAKAFAARPDMAMILATGFGELPADYAVPMVKLGKPFNQDELIVSICAAINLKCSSH